MACKNFEMCISPRRGYLSALGIMLELNSEDFRVNILKANEAAWAGGAGWL